MVRFNPGDLFVVKKRFNALRDPNSFSLGTTVQMKPGDLFVMLDSPKLDNLASLWHLILAKEGLIFVLSHFTSHTHVFNHTRASNALSR